MKKGKQLGKDIKTLPLEIRAEMALKEAVAEAIAEHKRRGYPIVVWRSGRTVSVPPEKIVVPSPSLP